MMLWREEARGERTGKNMGVSVGRLVSGEHRKIRGVGTPPSGLFSAQAPYKVSSRTEPEG